MPAKGCGLSSKSKLVGGNSRACGYISFFVWMLPSLKDYYPLLQVTEKQSTREIRQAYRDLSEQLHPEENTAANAHEQFVALHEAYCVLRTIIRKKRYDKLRKSKDWTDPNSKLYRRVAISAKVGRRLGEKRAKESLLRLKSRNRYQAFKEGFVYHRENFSAVGEILMIVAEALTFP